MNVVFGVIAGVALVFLVISLVNHILDIKRRISKKAAGSAPTAP